jgi:hemerythrin-like domain-containing protein
MVEHRLIEKMLAVVRREMESMAARNEADPLFIDTVVDFVHTYADRTHHGKEEAIMFRDLAAKKMSPEDQLAMQELIDEHIFARKTVAELVQARNDYAGGHPDALQTILSKLRTLVEFYPEHIRREDQVFFPNSERYLSQAEQDAMLLEFWEFDRQMIHDKYRQVVAALTAGQ